MSKVQYNVVTLAKILALMIRYTPASQRSLSLFKTPFENHLAPDNRWVKMAEIVPWDDFANVIQKRMSKQRGRGSIDLRVVIGALLVKYIMNLPDEETIRYIQENIYVQYFVGLPAFQKEQVFTASLFVTLRKRLGLEGANKMNELLLERAKELRLIHSGKEDNSGKNSTGRGKKAGRNKKETEAAGAARYNEDGELTHKGVMKMDATVAPQNIKYPTDVCIVAKSRELSEKLIDLLYLQEKELWSKKPRTYRRKAKESYVKFSKKRQKSKRAIRQERKRQLGFLRRNIRHIGEMLDKLENAGVDVRWRYKDWKTFWVIQEVYRQQSEMHRKKTNRIDNRIVSVFQPYVRPIKRGKSGSETEFGAKLNAIEFDGYVLLEYLDYENYNESGRLEFAVEHYRKLLGYYPAGILVDRIYLTRKNRAWLKEKGIAHYGPALGRPSGMSAAKKSFRKKVQDKRSEIEGKFGVAKLKYGLDNIKTKRKDTSFSEISLLLLALNIFTLSQALFFSLISWLRCIYRVLESRMSIFMSTKVKFACLVFTGNSKSTHIFA